MFVTHRKVIWSRLCCAIKPSVIYCVDQSIVSSDQRQPIISSLDLLYIVKRSRGKPKMRASTFMVLLVAVCLALSAAALPLRQRKSPPQRVRRKIGQLNSISSTPLEYMRNLLLKIDDEEGKPKNPVEDPLTVWCFMDEGRRPVECPSSSVCITHNFTYTSYCKSFASL